MAAVRLRAAGTGRVCAYAVENAGLFAAFGDEVTELAHKLLAAGVRTREGERDHERNANSV